MRSRKTRRNGNDRPLKWIVGLGCAGIGVFGIGLAVLFSYLNLFRGLPYTTSPATLTAVSIVPQPPTASPFPTAPATLDSVPPVATVSEPVVEFDPSISNQVRPEDVADEVVYFGMGAGVCEETAYPVPLISQEPADGELASQSTLIACGWEKDEILRGTIVYPDGRVNTYAVEVEEIDGIFYGLLEFTPALADPVGIYTFTLEGRRATVSATAEFHQPDGPHLYWVDASHILFYEFAPQESVRLVCYEQSIFTAWQEFKMDPGGNLTVTVKTDRCDFAALGESSGEIHILAWGRFDLMSNIDRAACGGLLSRLKVYGQARTVFGDGSIQSVRSEAGFSKAILTSLPEGAIVWTESDSTCADGSTWWPINTEDGLMGWMPEEQNGVYLLEPVP